VHYIGYYRQRQSKAEEQGGDLTQGGHQIRQYRYRKPLGTRHSSANTRDQLVQLLGPEKRPTPCKDN